MKYLVNGELVITTENWKERMGEITIEQFAKENNFQIYDQKPVQVLQEEKQTEIENELKQINIWFQQNDYIANKIVTKEWKETDPRWTDYLKHRSEKRKRQDELNALINL